MKTQIEQRMYIFIATDPDVVFAVVAENEFVAGNHLMSYLKRMNRPLMVGLDVGDFRPGEVFEWTPVHWENARRLHNDLKGNQDKE